MFFLHSKTYFSFEFHPAHGWLFGAARNLDCLELALRIKNARTQKRWAGGGEPVAIFTLSKQ